MRQILELDDYEDKYTNPISLANALIVAHLSDKSDVFKDKDIEEIQYLLHQREKSIQKSIYERKIEAILSKLGRVKILRFIDEKIQDTDSNFFVEKV